MRAIIYATLAILLFLDANSSFGQKTGIYNFGSFDSFGNVSIDRGSLNVHFSFSVVSKAGRGIPFGQFIRL